MLTARRLWPGAITRSSGPLRQAARRTALVVHCGTFSYFYFGSGSEQQLKSPAFVAPSWSTKEFSTESYGQPTPLAGNGLCISTRTSQNRPVLFEGVRRFQCNMRDRESFGCIQSELGPPHGSGIAFRTHPQLIANGHGAGTPPVSALSAFPVAIPAERPRWCLSGPPARPCRASSDFEPPTISPPVNGSVAVQSTVCLRRSLLVPRPDPPFRTTRDD